MKLSELSEFYNANVEATHIPYLIKLTFNAGGCVYKNYRQEFPHEFQLIILQQPPPPEPEAKKHKRGRGAKVSDEEVRHARMLWKNGMSRNEIAKKLNRCQFTIWRITK